MSSATITTSARLMNFTPQTEEQAMVRKVAVSSFLGNFIEWFDYASYSYFATTIALVFFPTDNHTVAMLQTFGVFALSFILRPIGALFWGSYGDKKGRKAALAHSIMFMSGASFLIGCLPSYSVIGVGAPILLLLLRMVQGFSASGEYAGAATFLGEYAPTSKRGIYCSLIPASTAIGLLAGSTLATLMTANMNSSAMVGWGWRVPFLLSAILVIVGLVVRVHMEETPIFRMAQEQKKVVKSPLTEVFRKSWRQVLQATFLVAVTYTLFYTLATWSLAWGTKEQGEGGGNLGFTNQEYLLMLMISICVFALFIVLSCLYADKIGRRRVLTFSSCALVVFAVLFPFLLDGGLVGQKNFFANMVFLCVGFALMGIAFGPIGAFLPELFDANVRYSGSGIGYNLAAIVGAAFVPTIATWLSSHWGVHSVGLYLAVMAVCCLVSVLTCKETKDVDFTK